MRVAYDPQIFLRQRAGGVSRLFTELIREFDGDKGLGVNALLPFSTTNNALLTAALPERSFRTTPSWLPRGLLYAPWWVRGPRVGRHLDIVHHTYYGRRFLRAPGGSLQVTTIYDMIPELFPETRRRLDFLTVKKRYVEEADHIICVSESTRRDLGTVYRSLNAPITVVPSGVGPEFTPSAPRLPEWPRDYLLHVGHRRGYKGGETLFQAFSLVKDDHPDLMLMLAGGGPLTMDEKEELVDLQIERRTLQQQLPDSAMPSAYANARLFIFPSEYEGFGLPVLEAMASGTPVLLSNASSLPEVGGEAAEFFPTQDPDALAKQMSRLLADDTLRHDNIKQGLRRASHFSWIHSAERTADVYRKTKYGGPS